MGVEEPPLLRYVDAPTAEVTVDIAAAPERVWTFVTDVQLSSRFSDEFLGANLLDGATALAVGTRFVGRNYHPVIGTWETTSTITACEPHELLAYDVGGVDGPPSASWRFSLEPTATGTRLTQWMRIGPGRSGVSRAIEAMPDKESKILHRRLREHRANMEATLAGIKALAEG